MDPREFDQHLDDYLDGTLSGELLETFERAIDENPAYRREVERHRRIVEELAGIPSPPTPPGLKERILARVAEEGAGATAAVAESPDGDPETRGAPDAFAGSQLAAAAMGKTRVVSPDEDTAHQRQPAPEPAARRPEPRRLRVTGPTDRWSLGRSLRRLVGRWQFQALAAAACIALAFAFNLIPLPEQGVGSVVAELRERFVGVALPSAEERRMAAADFKDGVVDGETGAVTRSAGDDQRTLATGAAENSLFGAIADVMTPKPVAKPFPIADSGTQPGPDTMMSNAVVYGRTEMLYDRAEENEMSTEPEGELSPAAEPGVAGESGVPTGLGEAAPERLSDYYVAEPSPTSWRESQPFGIAEGEEIDRPGLKATTQVGIHYGFPATPPPDEAREPEASPAPPPVVRVPPPARPDRLSDYIHQDETIAALPSEPDEGAAPPEARSLEVADAATLVKPAEAPAAETAARPPLLPTPTPRPKPVAIAEAAGDKDQTPSAAPPEDAAEVRVPDDAQPEPIHIAKAAPPATLPPTEPKPVAQIPAPEPETDGILLVTPSGRASVSTTVDRVVEDDAKDEVERLTAAVTAPVPEGGDVARAVAAAEAATTREAQPSKDTAAFRRPAVDENLPLLPPSLTQPDVEGSWMIYPSDAAPAEPPAAPGTAGDAASMGLSRGQDTIPTRDIQPPTREVPAPPASRPTPGRSWSDRRGGISDLADALRSVAGTQTTRAPAPPRTTVDSTRSGFFEQPAPRRQAAETPFRGADRPPSAVTERIPGPPPTRPDAPPLPQPSAAQRTPATDHDSAAAPGSALSALSAQAPARKPIALPSFFAPTPPSGSSANETVEFGAVRSVVTNHRLTQPPKAPDRPDHDATRVLADQPTAAVDAQPRPVEDSLRKTEPEPPAAPTNPGRREPADTAVDLVVHLLVNDSGATAGEVRAATTNLASRVRDHLRAAGAETASTARGSVVYLDGAVRQGNAEWVRRQLFALDLVHERKLDGLNGDDAEVRRRTGLDFGRSPQRRGVFFLQDDSALTATRPSSQGRPFRFRLVMRGVQPTTAP